MSDKATVLKQWVKLSDKVRLMSAMQHPISGKKAKNNSPSAIQKKNLHKKIFGNFQQFLVAPQIIEGSERITDQ